MSSLFDIDVIFQMKFYAIFLLCLAFFIFKLLQSLELSFEAR